MTYILGSIGVALMFTALAIVSHDKVESHAGTAAVVLAVVGGFLIFTACSVWADSVL